MRVGISTTETDPEALLARVLAAEQMAGAELAGQVTTARGLRGPGGGRAAVHRRRRRPRHQGQHPPDDGRARHRGARAARDVRASTSVLAVDPDGVFYSNGPGRPGRHHAPGRAAQVACWSRGIPYFGICFGNQLFGRALGFGTYKLKYGHRGINQPVMDRTTGKVEVTAHNHGFAVDAPLDRRPADAVRRGHRQSRVPQRRRGRGARAARRCRERSRRSRCSTTRRRRPGPHDAAYLFDRFCDLMAERQASSCSDTPTTPA